MNSIMHICLRQMMTQDDPISVPGAQYKVYYSHDLKSQTILSSLKKLPQILLYND